MTSVAIFKSWRYRRIAAHFQVREIRKRLTEAMHIPTVVAADPLQYIFPHSTVGTLLQSVGNLISFLYNGINLVPFYSTVQGCTFGGTHQTITTLQ